MTKFLISILVLSAFAANAQDIHFSQYLQAPQDLNPGLVGTDNSFLRANINYRNQWSVFDKAYRTMAFSADMPLFKKSSGSFMGAGINIFHDKAGKAGLARLHMAGTISGILQLSKNNYLSLGVQGSYNQHSINWGGLSWDAQYNGLNYDSSLPTGEAGGSLKKGFADVSVGVAYVKNGNPNNLGKGDNVSIKTGFAAYHLIRPDQSLTGSDKMNMRYNGFFTIEFGMGSSNLALIPSFAYWQQQSLREINGGMWLKYYLKQESQFTGFERGMAISFGGMYRLNDALVTALQFDYADYSIGVSYDINLSSLSTYSQARGGFEVMFCYRDLNGIFGQGSKHTKFL